MIIIPSLRKPSETREASPYSLATDAQAHDDNPVSVPPSSSLRATRMMTGEEWLVWGATMGNQKQLLGPLWYEGELCVLFADTNVGKSILAVQIADMVSRGFNADPLLPELMPQTVGQPVLYADFELSAVQFARRYTFEDAEGDAVPYRFSTHFKRLELSYGEVTGDTLGEVGGKTMAELIFADLEQILSRQMIRVLIIDNITFMAQGTEQAADALPLMKILIGLKKKYDMSILILAHTPKRNLSNPLTHNDLQGSKMIINFADSAFAIGKSVKGHNIRYIKQIKQRNTEQVYHDGNVMTCEIGRVRSDFVGFRALGCEPEQNHLRQRTERTGVSDDRMSMAQEIVRMRDEGKEISAIANELGIGRATVYRLMSLVR